MYVDHFTGGGPRTCRPRDASLKAIELLENLETEEPLVLKCDAPSSCYPQLCAAEWLSYLLGGFFAPRAPPRESFARRQAAAGVEETRDDVAKTSR